MGQFAKYVYSALFIASILFTVWFPSQNEFHFIFIGFTAAFLAYVFFLSDRLSFLDKFKFLFVVGLLARLCLVPLLPNLSDDIYRFYWDGMLSQHGFNPYALLPAEALQHFDTKEMNLIFSQLNSKEYYTIYPPVAQFFFYLAASTKSLFGFSVFLKLSFLGFEVLSFFFLTKLCERFNLEKTNVFFYFLNPLVIVEGVGNLHFETVMLGFFAAGIYFLSKSNYVKFVIGFVASVGTKLIPLIFGPILFLKFIKGRKSFTTLVIGVCIALLVFLPVYFGIQYSNFATSLDLYFRKFEFNASIYYVLREIGYYIMGYNTIQTIGPILGISVLLLILVLSFRPKIERLQDVLHICLGIVTVYLLCATTVHPWYLMTLVFLGVFAPYKYILIWSYLVLLSYATYSNPEFSENLFFVMIEYVVVFYFIYVTILNRSPTQLSK